MNLAEQLKIYNKTQQQFAIDLGVGIATVNRWINGKFFPSKLAQKRIKEIFNVYETERQKKGPNHGDQNWPEAS